MKPTHDIQTTRYKLELTTTADATGYFSCRTEEPLSPEQMIRHLRRAPMDEFMHNQLLRHVSSLPEKDQTAIFENAISTRDTLMEALCCEAGFTGRISPALKEQFETIPATDLLLQTPLINIKSKSAKDQKHHRRWIFLFRENMFRHVPLPDKNPFPEIYDPKMLNKAFSRQTDIEAIRIKHASKPRVPLSPLPDPAETAQKALDILHRIGILEGEELRHESSLSPIALMRQWRMKVAVVNGRQDYRLSGIQNSYGRGLSLDAARASNLMEVLERYAAFASIDRNGVQGFRTDYPLIHGAYSSLAGKNTQILYPNALCLETPYEDEPLYWMEAVTIQEGETRKIRIPAQIVFLFCNLDEPALFSGLGSTGLASGNTLAQAKVSALLEIFERDAEATTPYDLSQCFRAETRDPDIAPLFEMYRQCGMDVIFQDLTSRFGIPCCKCFVKGQDGTIAKGVGAHLSAKRALLSALTETPYPFPKGPPSLVGPDHLVMVPLENLPDYSTGQPEKDLAILEEVLFENGLQPVYVDLTRKDTGIPVVRAIVPGLEVMADFDEFSRVSPSLFYHYLRMVKAIPSSL